MTFLKFFLNFHSLYSTKTWLYQSFLNLVTLQYVENVINILNFCIVLFVSAYYNHYIVT